MPRMYRVMAEMEGRPTVGSARDMLGVRPGVDITPDGNGVVHPGTRGMSVVSCVCRLPPTLVPRGLHRDVNLRGVVGIRSKRLWCMGEGGFVSGRIGDELDLQVAGRPGHGCIVPVGVVPLQEFQDALAATRDQWVIDEQRNSNCTLCG
jgi:hypothetical protein